MKKSILLATIIIAATAVTSCHQYVPPPGEADMVQYSYTNPAYDYSHHDPSS